MSTLLAFNATMPYYGLFMQVSLVFRWLPTLGHLPVGCQWAGSWLVFHQLMV